MTEIEFVEKRMMKEHEYSSGCNVRAVDVPKWECDGTPEYVCTYEVVEGPREGLQFELDLCEFHAKKEEDDA